MNSIGQKLKDFSHKFGVPEHMNFYGAQYQVGRNKNFMKKINRLGIQHHISAPRRTNDITQRDLYNKQKFGGIK